MELSDVIKTRRSIRKFKSDDVAREIIEDLIDTARLAPSAKNRQPWEFLIVKDNIKNEIADMMLEQEKKSKISLERKLYNVNSSVKESAYIIKEAPILILVFRPKDDNWIIEDLLSIGAAIEHICLRSTDLGLGSLWIRDIVYTQDKIAKFVNKDDKELISAISIGYSNETPKQRPRKQLTNILKWY